MLLIRYEEGRMKKILIISGVILFGFLVLFGVLIKDVSELQKENTILRQAIFVKTEEGWQCKHCGAIHNTLGYGLRYSEDDTEGK